MCTIEMRNSKLGDIYMPVFSPGFLEWKMGAGQVEGQGGGRNVYSIFTNLLLCSASAPLAKR